MSRDMRVLALDPGERRVGIAISDPTGAVARPLQTLARKSKEEDFAAIAALVAEHDVELVVIGRPLSLDGTEGPQARRAARYGLALAEHLPVPVVSWDERFTTAEAEEIICQNRGKKRGKDELDAIAAAVILQRYLDTKKPDPSYIWRKQI
ncbi:MAG: Holliday junction resolvase RuvX [Chloroflexi bacterium]|nr:MAG: Holliday junction resolvase RuvX [Anaerolineaceae bacterium 4572_32.2]RLC81823.1 MAG: Holliday junction resolvase RuvX [Chloroflexota bacterium]RLC87793.1 MAG: Holliday junction resolvase RuvX [Chloroflexota bacterium]